VLWLWSDAASYSRARIWSVDGGLLAKSANTFDAMAAFVAALRLVVW